ncbi:auxin canalization protein (DUF828) [Rhynchospora pubera]|uniref:Auxin canalization protein (DUF828) n=1 Tax=Rhynchospora pubera TaxID=906938 RepID=A0AAV8G828_9POAL|nr:auxin canalization protein (DUF828) [Rhynchospora pubera]
MNLERQMMEPDSTPPEPMDVLSNEWCSYAIQVFQPKLEDCVAKSMDKSIVAIKDNNITPSLRGNHIKVDSDDLSGLPSWNFDDLKSWIWIQKAIHPELDYDLCMKKKWFSRKITHWNGINIKKWMKELKQRRKEEERLQNAEVHAAISVAGVAAALAAVAAQNTGPRIDGSLHQQQQQPTDPLRETAVASAAALVAAQCVQVAEAVGAKKEQIASAINSAVAATDANNILTLTAAAATSLRGAAALRSRPCRSAGISPRAHKDFDFDYSRSKASLAKGDEILVATPDVIFILGKCRLRSVSAILNREGKIILKIKKTNMLMAFSSSNESVVYDLDLSLNNLGPEKKDEKEEEPFSFKIATSKGKIKLKIYDHVLYKKWVTTINHMLTLSKTFRGYELESCEN